MQDHYEILQVHPKADQDTIQDACERLCQRYDPARMEQEGAADELVEMARRKRDDIERACAVLSDPTRRAAYDEGLEAAKAVASAATAYQPHEEFSEEELIDYRPLPPARKQERPRDFDSQPYLSPQALLHPRGRAAKAHPFWSSPAAIAALLTFIIGFTSLLITEGGTRMKHATTMQQQQTQQPASAEQLTSQFEGQIVSAKQVADQVPDNPNAWINLGNVLYDSVEIVHEHMSDSEAYRELLPRWLEATEAYSKALELDPDNAVVRSDLAVSLCNYGTGIGDQSYVEAGLEQARQAFEDGPEEGRVLLNLGSCLVSVQPPQTQEALEHWRKILLLPEPGQNVMAQAQRLIRQYEQQIKSD